MQQIFKSTASLMVKMLVLLGAIVTIGFGSIASANAAPSIPQVEPDVIQPFELTKPAATRTEAYDDIAKLNKDPKALIAAENKEEKAEEKLYEQEQKAVQKAENNHK
jgi:hypothetical protein